MKVKAYRCDNCGDIFKAELITGVVPTENLFSKMDSYPITKKVEATNVHYCLQCYSNNVSAIIEKQYFHQVNKKRNLELSLKTATLVTTTDYANFERWKKELHELINNLLERGSRPFKERVNELHFALRQQCILNFRQKKFD